MGITGILIVEQRTISPLLTMPVKTIRYSPEGGQERYYFDALLTKRWRFLTADSPGYS